MDGKSINSVEANKLDKVTTVTISGTFVDSPKSFTIVDGEGVPIGGTTGQLLAKSSDIDGATHWVNPSGSIGSHNDLENRDANDAHPISAITGLANALGNIVTAIEDTYTKTEVNSIASDKADKSNTYTKTEVNDGFIPRVTSLNNRLPKFSDASGNLTTSNLISNAMGDLGLNVLPSLWHNSVKALETQAGAFYSYGSEQIVIIQNAYQGLDGIFRYKTNAPATLVTQGGGEFRFYTAPYGTTETSVNFTEKMRIDSVGNVLVTGSGALGYGVGSGGTVTQTTSKSSAVTLNKPSGTIVMNNAVLPAGALVTMTVNNSTKGTSDNVVVSIIAGVSSEQSYNVWCYPSISNGVFFIVVKNISLGSLYEPIQIKFDIIKGAIA